MAANLVCTTVCHCQGGSFCINEQTRATEEADDVASVIDVVFDIS